MTWILIAISSYLITAIVFLIDKHLLTGPIPSPKTYTFYVGILTVLVLILIPFVNFQVPEVSQILLSLVAGAVFLYALFWFYKSLQVFEPSRVVPAIGGLLPLFVFGLIYVFSGGTEILDDFLPFILLVLGSVLITYEGAKISMKSLWFSAITAFLFAFHFVLIKYVYIAQPFWSGFIWIRIGTILTALCFFLLFAKDIIKQKTGFKKKTAGIFLANQTAGAGSFILLNWAIALAPLAYIAVVNALQGTQYVFLLVFSFWILKEKISRKALFQKIIAILLIGAGLAILAF